MQKKWFYLMFPLFRNSLWRLQLEKPNKHLAQSAKQTLDSFLWCWYLNAEQILALTILLSREKHENMKSLLCFTENALNYISPTVSPQGTQGLNWELGLLDEMQEMLRSEMEAENCYHWLFVVSGIRPVHYGTLGSKLISSVSRAILRVFWV